ncbi:hypothetical protein M3Y95_00487300 [Aphelenchoides besseyi]|nr:hypothetical protein M3Y95_00487300 [Aphelenchoides besseyi]
MNTHVFSLLPLGYWLLFVQFVVVTAVPRLVDHDAVEYHRNVFHPLRYADVQRIQMPTSHSTSTPNSLPTLRTITPVHSTTQIASLQQSTNGMTHSRADNRDPLRLVFDRLLQHDITRTFARMFTSTNKQSDPIVSNPKDFTDKSDVSLNNQAVNQFEWKNLLLGQNGLLTSIFKEFKNKRSQDIGKAKIAAQQQQSDTNPGMKLKRFLH